MAYILACKKRESNLAHYQSKFFDEMPKFGIGILNDIFKASPMENVNTKFDTF